VKGADLPRPMVAPNSSIGFYLQKRVKELHYWLRKGDGEKAARATREAVHMAKVALARGEVRP
jgi:hypothetical protein